MALDSAQKRQAVPGAGRPWMRGQFPDVAKGRAWRSSVGLSYPVAAFAADATAAISGTTAFTEALVQAGGEPIVITIANDNWVAAGAVFNAQRQNILNGISSAQSEVTGWNNEIRDKELVTSVVRTSNTVVTITLSPASAYNVAQNETITVVVPNEALTTSTSPLTATPIIGVTADAPLLADHILKFQSASNIVKMTAAVPALGFIELEAGGSLLQETGLEIDIGATDLENHILKFESSSNIIKMIDAVPTLAFIQLEAGGSLLQETGLEIEN